MRGNADDDVVLERSGAVRAEGKVVKERLGKAAGRYRLVEAAGPIVLLTRAVDNDKSARLLMAGEIISRTTVMEVMGMIAMNNWHGELTIYGGGGLRKLSIAEGALKAATSTVLSERLGEMMTQTGMITADELARCVLDASADGGGAGRRFGEIAIDKGFVNREQLFQALGIQMQRIFGNALLEDAGQYVMMLPAEGDETPNMFLHLPIQSLLMESVQRIDEMALFRERIPSGDVCPVMTKRSPRLSLAESLRPVVALADGEHSILDIARVLRADEYQTTKWVCQLMQIGLVEIRTQRKLDEAQALRMIGRFNQVLRRIFDTMQRYQKNHDLHWTLDAWIRDTALAPYFTDTLQREGTIDAPAAVIRLQMMHEERPFEALHQALQELAGFAMLSAGAALPREAEQALSRIVSQQLAKLRSLGD